MRVRLDLYPPTLIQAVRIAQAVMEAGATVSVGKGYAPILRYLKAFFELKYTYSDAPAAKVKMSHKAPFVYVNRERRPLLYPHSIPKKCANFWADKREGTLFLGLIPPHRVSALTQWNGRARIVHTTAGRKSLRRFWDENYLKTMGQAEFILCPNGGWNWTYRVVEACLLGATPILQTECKWYEGMYYHKWDDAAFERKNVEENFEWAVRTITMPHETILKNL